MTLDIIAAVILTPTVLLAAWYDLCFLRIPNKLNLVLLGQCFALAIIMFPLDALLFQIMIAIGVFVLLFILQLAGQIGGGDVKMVGALMLVAPVGTLPQLSNFLMMIILGWFAMLVLVFGLRIILSHRRLDFDEAMALKAGDWSDKKLTIDPRRWVSLSGWVAMPLGVGFAFALVAHYWFLLTGVIVVETGSEASLLSKMLGL